MLNKYSFLQYLFYILLLLVFLLPLERLGSFTLAGFTIRISQILLILIFLLFLGYSLYQKKFKIILPSPLVLYIVFLCVTLLSLMAAKEKILGLTVVIFLSSMFFVPYVFINLIDSKKKLKIAIYVLLLSAFIFSLFGFFQFLGDMAGLPSSITGLSYRYVGKVLGFPRIQSTFIEPLYFANYLIIPLVLSFFLFIKRTDVKNNKYFILLFIISLISIILTFSKGAIGAVILLAFAVILFQIRSIFYRQNLPYIFIISFLLIALSWFAFATIKSLPDFEKIYKKAYNIITGASIAEREEAYNVAWEAFTRYPLLGIGAGNFGPYFAGYPTSPPDFGWAIVNNQYLEILAETGLLGFFVFLVFIGLIFYRSVLAYLNTDDRFLKAVILGLNFAFLGILIQYLTFSTLYIMHVWVLIGLILAGQEMILKRENF